MRTIILILDQLLRQILARREATRSPEAIVVDPHWRRWWGLSIMSYLLPFGAMSWVTAHETIRIWPQRGHGGVDELLLYVLAFPMFLFMLFTLIALLRRSRAAYYPIGIGIFYLGRSGILGLMDKPTDSDFTLMLAALFGLGSLVAFIPVPKR